MNTCCYQGTFQAALYGVGDIRFVLLAGHGCAIASESLDWERGINGGVDAWIFAELVVFARRSEYSFDFIFTYFRHCHV